jgi:transcription-repair coupling factor (superfamily II helicase)
LYQGFIDEENQITCYTDHQIFERYHKFNIKKTAEKTEYYFKRIDNVVVGDYVTHIDHGIGRFEDCKKYRSRTKHRKL